MKISELVRKLKQVQKQHGNDLEVTIADMQEVSMVGVEVIEDKKKKRVRLSA